MSKSKEKVKARFFERLSAFIIDMLIVLVVSSLLSYPFTSSVSKENQEKLTTETQQIIDDYTNQKIDTKTYFAKASDISYDVARENGLSTIISIFVSCLYFIVFQFMNDGQTFGKKLFKIKVIKQSDEELTLNDMMFRSFIANSIIFDIMLLCITLFTGKDIYLYSVYIIQFIQYVIMFVSAIMILSRKDRKSIHDIIAKTEVVIA